MLYYLSRGHELLYGTKHPLPYGPHKLITNELLNKTKTNFRYCTGGHKELIEVDMVAVEALRERILGKYIEWILPTSIINNVLTQRPLLDTMRMARLKESVAKYGVLSPPLVHVVPKNHKKFNPDYPDLQFIVREGRHRCLAAEIIGYKEPIPAFVLIIKGDEDGYQRLRDSRNNTHRTPTIS